MNDAARQGVSALNVLSSPMLHLNRRVIIKRTAELRLPAIYQWPETAEEGGLLAMALALSKSSSIVRNVMP
jgi:putative ABC transport system substrate-binding protein